MDIIRTLQPGAVIFILVGATILGGAIGSFLNVVVYRLPAGLSLSRPSSRCPRCGHAIRPYHNLPVFGWLLLRGKCYDCGEPISIRYPIIEAVVAIMFLIVVWVEWFGLKSPMTFPLPEPTGKQIDFLLFRPFSFTLLVMSTIAHLSLLTTLLAVGMIEWDHEKAPSFIWIPALIASAAWWIVIFFSTWKGDGFPQSAFMILYLYGMSVITGIGAGLLLLPVNLLCNVFNKPQTSWIQFLLGFLCIGTALTFWDASLIAAIYLISQVSEIIIFGMHRKKLIPKPFSRMLWLWGITLGFVLFVYLRVPFF